MVLDQHAIHNPKSEPKVLRKKKRSSYTFGFMLILLGVFFLFKKAGLIEITWPLILMFTGIANLVETWLKRRTGGVFPGVFLLLLGLLFLADSNNWVTGGVARNWPLVILVLSFSLIITAAVVRDRRKHWSSGVTLLFAGGFLHVVEYGWITWGRLNEILMWWPILLIIAGIWFMFRKKRQEHTDKV